MLPDKRKLRKSLESYREPPKAVLSYFRDKNDAKEYAVIGKTLSADVYTISLPVLRCSTP